MAEIFPNEGANFIMKVFPKNGANSSSIALRLFTSQTASTVVAASDTLAGALITETTYGSYAVQALAASTWGASSVSAGLGVKTAYSQITFPTATSGPSTINGLYITDLSVTPTVYLAQANFDDATAVTVNTNDVIKVTPAIIYGN